MLFGCIFEQDYRHKMDFCHLVTDELGDQQRLDLLVENSLEKFAKETDEQE